MAARSRKGAAGQKGAVEKAHLLAGPWDAKAQATREHLTRGSLYARIVEDGLDVIRLELPISGERDTWRRIPGAGPQQALADRFYLDRTEKLGGGGGEA